MTRGAMPSQLNEQGRGSFNRVGIAPRASTLPTAKGKDAFGATFAEQKATVTVLGQYLEANSIGRIPI